MSALRPYIDFKLYLTTTADGGACQAALLPTPEVGETLAPVVVPTERLPDTELLARLAAKSITAHRLVALGQQLADCLLPEGVIRERFRAAYDGAGPASGVRLRLIIADHALRQWPWEYAYYNMLDGPDSLSGFLLLNPRISLVRHEPLPFPHPRVTPAADVTDLRLLIVAASPEDQPALNVGAEIGHILKAVEDFRVEGVRITRQALEHATPSELFRELMKPAQPTLFHFAGHGLTQTKTDWFAGGAAKQEGYLLLAADKSSKASAPLPATELARHLGRAGVRLAVLGACDSAAAFVAQEIPAVIAMQYGVRDEHAEVFSRALYSALASGLALDEAMSLGRLAMLGATAAGEDLNVEWGVPVLYSRLPTGALFPERMAQPAAMAERLRTVVSQTVERIAQTGQVTGVAIGPAGGGELHIAPIEVQQRVTAVEGSLVGVSVASAGGLTGMRVSQELGTVSGQAVGLRIG
jgi:hypothetical protein